MQLSTKPIWQRNFLEMNYFFGMEPVAYNPKNKSILYRYSNKMDLYTIKVKKDSSVITIYRKDRTPILPSEIQVITQDLFKSKTFEKVNSFQLTNAYEGHFDTSNHSITIYNDLSKNTGIAMLSDKSFQKKK